MGNEICVDKHRAEDLDIVEICFLLVDRRIGS